MNIETIDKWLDEEYGISYTELEKLHNRLVDKNIELDIKYIKALEVAQDRFDRIQKAIEYMKSIENNYDQDIYLQFKEYQEYQDLLNILKGSDNNE